VYEEGEDAAFRIEQTALALEAIRAPGVAAKVRTAKGWSVSAIFERFGDNPTVLVKQMGGTNAYFCERCPLVIELGGHIAEPHIEWVQVVCASCGTMHRLMEEHGSCQVTALPGPVRATRMVTVRTAFGDEVETSEWVSETDWQVVGPHSDGIQSLSQFPCCHCGQIGRMVTLAQLLYPGGYTRGALPREDCPTCGRPLEFLAISDFI
jgi:hypothetical protein